MDQSIPHIMSSGLASTALSEPSPDDSTGSEQVDTPSSHALIESENGSHKHSNEDSNQEADPESGQSALIASEQILPSFPTSPAEIRSMIYVAMVNNPRLLRFVQNPIANVDFVQLDLYPGTASYVSGLPVSLFLNKEAFKETKRLVNFVSTAGPNYTPWSYINPKFDVVYCPFYYRYPYPAAQQAPGLRTIAIRMDDLFWRTDFAPYVVDHIKECMEMIFEGIQDLPDLKELLLVRETLGDWTLPGMVNPVCGRPLRFSTDFDSKDDDEMPYWNVPYIERHPCGFFGVVNDAIEDMDSEEPGESRGNRPRNLAEDWVKYSYSEVVLEEAKELFRVSYDTHGNGRAPPQISVVYSLWVNPDGTWNMGLEGEPLKYAQLNFL